MIKKFFQFLSITTHSKTIKIESEINKFLEVRKIQGRYILDSPNANYSYGSLYKAFQFAFQQISLKNFQPQKILILGLGAGCVLEILENYFHNYSYEVTAIEIDPKVIEISKKYFDIQRFKNLKIHNLDAQIFIEQANEVYDFIIIDLFIDLHIPEFLFKKTIIQKLQLMTEKNGAILINTIPSVQDNSPLINELSQYGKLEILERYKNLNEMIYWKNVN